MLEKLKLQAFIPPHGTYKGGPEGFSYDRDNDLWACPQGKQVTFRKVFVDKGTLKYLYLTRKSDCTGCPLKQKCIGKSCEKRITITIYKDEYDRAIERVNSPQGRRLKKKRMSTVEPVFGTLLNFMGMRKVNTLGIKQANKCMQMAAVAYNIKKYMKFMRKAAQSMSEKAETAAFESLCLLATIISPLWRLKNTKTILASYK